ncbi:Fructosamine Ketosamine-3-kinase [Cordyceps militaris]|uniref:protein-ribulosamine 3-kinase n=1 Tax=Cordyceps militaris TaxID=73501 RepID=A0A2H4S8I4_CORMI|nr:Fructosamine Ketosamine-3-kinase [Cordyceps militaris]
MASPGSLSTVAADPLEHISAAQSDVDEMKQAFLHGQFPVDAAVLAGMLRPIPELSCRHGDSIWSFTAKVVTVQRGTEVSYFLKCVPGEIGQPQLLGEFTGMTELWKLSPEFVVKPLGWGKLADSVKDWYFLLMEFKAFSPESTVDADTLARRVVQLHRRSQAQSDTGGRFGFPVQTFDGARLQSVGWDASWVSFFSKLLAEAHRQDTEANGAWPALEKAYRKVQSHLVPRLLGALEENGNKITPTLIHGDLWEGNVKIEAATGEPWIFDCAAYYGHHEMELGIWRAARHAFSSNGYISRYMTVFSEQASHGSDIYPDDEADDRVLLYSAKTNLMYSACFPKAQSRTDILNDFHYLLNKYGIGMEDREYVPVSVQSQRTETEHSATLENTHASAAVAAGY